MSPAARSFYNRHFLLSVLLPAYIMALLSYGSAWLLLSAMGGGPAFIGVFVMLGLSRILAWLGFLASGVPAAQVPPTAAQRERLLALLEPDGPGGADPEHPDPQFAGPLPVSLLELGVVPYLASGGLYQGQLWISTHSLENSDDETLRCMLAHEGAHAAQGLRGCPGGCIGATSWADLSWLIAWPIAWYAQSAGQPLLLLLAALIHVSLWLHLGQLQRQRSERSADLAAAQRFGRELYARALLRHLQQFDTKGSPLRRARLRGMGFSPEEIQRLLDAEA
ncbi:hypothetical protein IT575_13355 [bacterium]|nr:hypothetical protein [bacterium]